MKFGRILGSIVLALVLVGSPTGTRAQDKSSHTYVVVVGHVVTLSWTASTTSGVTYNVYVGSVSGGPYNKIGNTATLQFQDVNATAGNTYYYVVTALDSTGDESAYSNQVSATIPTP